MGNNRPKDWSEFGYSSDPVSGDPDKIAGQVQKLHESAKTLRSARKNLKNLMDPKRNVGEGFQKILEDIEMAREAIRKIESRIDGAELELGMYAHKLEESQTESLTAYGKGKKAAAERNHCKYQFDYWDGIAQETQDPVEKVEAQSKRKSWERQYETADDKFKAAKADIEEAEHKRNAAAQKVMKKLEEIEGSSEVTDSWWDGVVNFFENPPEWLQWIWDKVIGPILKFFDDFGIIFALALVVIWIINPAAGTFLYILGTVLTDVLITVAVLNTAVKAVEATVTIIKASSGYDRMEKAVATTMSFVVTAALTFFSSAKLFKGLDGSKVTGFDKLAQNLSNTTWGKGVASSLVSKGISVKDKGAIATKLANGLNTTTNKLVSNGISGKATIYSFLMKQGVSGIHKVALKDPIKSMNSLSCTTAKNEKCIIYVQEPK
jgi:hypothetical protein